MSQPPANQPGMTLKADDQVLRGIYANALQISHTKDEVIFDFLSVLPPQGQLVSRVITSPAHAKQILQALKQNLEQYENQHGRLESASAPNREFGFSSSPAS